MFKRYLIVASKLDPAGTNITTQLSQFGNYDFYLVEDDMLYNKNLNFDKFRGYDFIVFASKHASKVSRKTISIHTPGNFGEANFGGEERKVCPSSALFQKSLFESLHNVMEEHTLKGYELTLEATHHGPLIDIPCVFLEIGSGEYEWKDRKAGFVVAKALHEAIKTFKENPYYEIAVSLGSTHYCPAFNKIQLNSNIAISHVISKYNFPLTEEMILEAIKKTHEEVDFVLVDWKGLGRVEERNKVIGILEKNYLQWKKTSEISK